MSIKYCYHTGSEGNSLGKWVSKKILQPVGLIVQCKNYENQTTDTDNIHK